jgi:hypothetical protein
MPLPARVARVLLSQIAADCQSLPERRLSRLQFSQCLQHVTNPPLGRSQIQLPMRVARVLLGQPPADRQSLPERRLSRPQFSLRPQHATNPALGPSQLPLPIRVARVLLDQMAADRQILFKRRLSRLKLAMRLQHITKQASGISFRTWVLCVSSQVQNFAGTVCQLGGFASTDASPSGGEEHPDPRPALHQPGILKFPERRGQRIAVLWARATAPITVKRLQLRGAALRVATQ